MTATDRQLVSYEEAAQRLGVSVRTVQRRVRGGQLATVSDNGRQLVVLPADEHARVHVEPGISSMDEKEEHAHDHGNDRSHGYSASRMQELEARVSDLEADRDQWRTMAAKLSDTVAEQNRMIAAQFLDRAHAEGRVLAAETVADMPAPTHTTVAPPRRSWSLRDAYRRLRGRR